MKLVDRVKAILLSPNTEWPAIEAEQSDIAAIYRHYLVYLAAIPAIAGFIGTSIIGFGMMGVSVRVPFFSGLVNAVVGYAVSLAMFYVVALIADSLAPKFGGTRNALNAFKLIAYSGTAALVGGVFYMIPAMALLGTVCALYSLYLLYTGVPVLMKVPGGRALPYTVLLIVCVIIAAMLLSLLTRCGMPSRAGLGAAAGSAVSINTPSGSVSVDTAKLEALSKKLEEATQKMSKEQAAAAATAAAAAAATTNANSAAAPAAASGKNPAIQGPDLSATGKAMGDVLAALGGSSTGTHDPMPAADLKKLLPDSLGSLKRQTIEAQDAAPLGLKTSQVKAEYGGSGPSIQLEITDTGGLAGVLAMASWANVTRERETPESTEKVYRSGKRSIKESASKDGKRASYSVVLANGVLISGEGRDVPLETVKAAVQGLDLGKLEANGSKS